MNSIGMWILNTITNSAKSIDILYGAVRRQNKINKLLAINAILVLYFMKQDEKAISKLEKRIKNLEEKLRTK